MSGLNRGNPNQAEGGDFDLAVGNGTQVVLEGMGVGKAKKIKHRMICNKSVGHLQMKVNLHIAQAFASQSGALEN